MPCQRTGPGKAGDGELKFDVTKFNQAYFDRLRSRVIAARDRGIYVSVMLFQGWCVFKFGGNHDPWLYHPLHKGNNVNGLDGDPNGNREGEEVHSLRIPAIIRRQEAYVRKVIDTVNDLDNVLYEISNETKPSAATKEWEYHIVRYVKQYEAGKPKQHPVGVTSNSVFTSDVLDSSPSEWVSLRRDWSKPETERVLRLDPAVADGRKVSILDTDHIGADTFIKDAAFSRRWVWKAFVRGHNPILMDALQIDDNLWTPNGAGLVAGRQAMGHSRTYANRMNLASTTPQPGLASTRYCLANVGVEYLIYQPKTGESFFVQLKAGKYRYEWFDPVKGATLASGQVEAPGGAQQFKMPFEGEAVLYLKARSF